jgi:predicted ATP-grasp superfamily ATP-dependent carboligase
MDASVPAVVLGVHLGTLGIARSLGELGVAVYAVDRDKRSPVFSSRYCRPVLWDLDQPSRLATVGFLRGLARRIGGRPLLIPTTDATSLLVAEHAEALAEPFRFPSVSPKLVRSFSDKHELFLLARRLGIPTPSVVIPRSVDDVHEYLETAVFPVVLKGIDGTRLQARSGQRMVIVYSSQELLDRYAALEDPAAPNLMLQEYVPGGDDTIWMFNGYFDHASECVAGFTGKKLRQHPVHVGSTSLGICLRNDTVATLTTALVKAVGYRGILDIGYRYDARDGLYKVLDPNPRIGSSFRLFVDANGMDVVRYLYLDMTGQPLPTPVSRDGRKWIVEDRDLETCVDYSREGQLTLGAWLRSLRGIDEGAWFARDDLAPFCRIAWRVARRGMRAAVRAAARTVRRAVSNGRGSRPEPARAGLVRMAVGGARSPGGH